LIDRFKALFIARAVLELEADLLALGAERKAELLRRADQYDREGQKGIAQELRQQAETLSIDKPLASVQVLITHLQADSAPSPRAVEATQQSAPAIIAPMPRATTTPEKKKP